MTSSEIGAGFTVDGMYYVNTTSLLPAMAGACVVGGSIGLLVVGWPQGCVEGDFQACDGAAVGPAVAVLDHLDGADADSGEFRDCACGQVPFGHDRFERVGELSDFLCCGVGAGGVRPVGEPVVGGGAQRQASGPCWRCWLVVHGDHITEWGGRCLPSAPGRTCVFGGRDGKVSYISDILGGFSCPKHSGVPHLSASCVTPPTSFASTATQPRRTR